MNASDAASNTVLIVDDDALVRTALAEYLRHCGYRVIEAMSGDEAMTALSEPAISIDIVFSAVEVAGSIDGFGLSRWVRSNHPGLHVVLAGNIAKAVDAAADICDDGPHLKRPYEPQQVLDWIKRLRRS